eukprot:Phypoly_transcript_03320.p1 GENE.Phypoly_transcript_03320~~Phypoly_transcript_03320.p1  ORF type:complete len:387 (+),score=71.69 Phypoly_transcript_03320:1278-2438(+)
MYGNSTLTATASSGFLSLAVSQSPQYVIPRSTNEFLQVAAAIKRLPTEIFGFGNVPVPVVVHNPLTHSISVKIGSESQTTIAAGQTAFSSAATTVFSDLQNTAGVPTKVLIQIIGMGNLTLATSVIYDYGIVVKPTQITSSGTLILLTNPSGKAFSGTLSAITNGHSSNSTFSFASGSTSLTLTLPTSVSPLTAQYTTMLNVYDSSRRVVSTKSYTLQLAADLGQYPLNSLPSAFHPYVGGDTPNPFTYSLVIGNGPTPLVPSFALHYSFAANIWTYFSVMPSSLLAISGTPTRVGMWIYGDGSGNVVSIRLQDATGQTLQYQFGAITWTGWNYVTLTLTNPGFWGGANDGVMHPPLSWDTFFILDNDNIANSGTIYFSAPTCLYN